MERIEKWLQAPFPRTFVVVQYPLQFPCPIAIVQYTIIIRIMSVG